MDKSRSSAVSLFSFCILLLFGFRSEFVRNPIRPTANDVDKSLVVKHLERLGDRFTGPSRALLQGSVGDRDRGSTTIPSHRTSNEHDEDTELSITESRHQAVDHYVRRLGPRSELADFG